MKIAIWDIEADLIPSTVIYCIAVKIIENDIDLGTKIFTQYPLGNSDGTLQDGLDLINNCNLQVGHNTLGYDMPTIERLLGKVTAKSYDTLLVSKLVWSKDELIEEDKELELPTNIYGKYSLKAFGYRLGLHKIQFDNFSELTETMMEYCIGDVKVTYELFKLLRRANIKQNVLDLEHKVQEIIVEQTINGFYFDINKARELYLKMSIERQEVYDRLLKQFKPRFLPDGKVKEFKRVRKSNKYRKQTKPLYLNVKQYKSPISYYKNGRIKFPARAKYKYFTEPHYHYNVWYLGDYQNIKLQQFEGTDNQIKIWLKAMYGFEFKTYTAKGNVKVDRDELESLGEYGKDLRRLMKLKKDMSQLGSTDNSLIRMYDTSMGSIHGKVDTLGANTHRCTHTQPNLAQIPQGTYFRELFIAPKGYKLVGADLANIEIRVLAHYLAEFGNTDYAKAVLSKDMHWYHAKLAGFWSLDDREWNEHTATPEMKSARKASKNFFFGYLYGQGDTIRGFKLWTKEIEESLVYTMEEYNDASIRIDKRLNDEGLFPLKKDLYVQPTETLILQTIYGKQVADSFLKNLTGIDLLIADVQKQSKDKGSVTAIDGRELHSRSPHSALNLLLQGSAGIIGKKWMINYHELAKDIKNHFYQQAYIHDEFQVACKEDKCNILGKCLEEGASMVTKQFNMNISIKADYGVGDNWSQTH